jgi:hypothetical protein
MTGERLTPPGTGLNRHFVPTSYQVRDLKKVRNRVPEPSRIPFQQSRTATSRSGQDQNREQTVEEPTTNNRHVHRYSTSEERIVKFSTLAVFCFSVNHFPDIPSCGVTVPEPYGLAVAKRIKGGHES